MKNHAIFISASMASTNVDSYRLAGIAPADVDNGVFVNLGTMALGQNDGGYEYNVAVAANGNGKLYVVDTPIPGTGVNIEAQVYSDPRYFYNIKGQPISLRKVVDGDHIEVAGIAGFTPTVGATCTVANGVLTVGAGKFTCVAVKTLAIGQATIPSYVLRYDA